MYLNSSLRSSAAFLKFFRSVHRSKFIRLYTAQQIISNVFQEPYRYFYSIIINRKPRTHVPNRLDDLHRYKYPPPSVSGVVIFCNLANDCFLSIYMRVKTWVIFNPNNLTSSIGSSDWFSFTIVGYIKLFVTYLVRFRE